MPVPVRAHLEVGFVIKAHGLTGEVGVRTFDAGSEVLFEVDRIRLRLKDGAERDLEIEGARQTPKEILLTLVGVEDRNAAEALVGSAVFVHRDDLEPPQEGEYFQGDLVGLLAHTEAGQALGEVQEVWSHGEVPTLVIRGEGTPELLVPFADDFVVSVDMEARRIVIRPPVLLE